MLFFLNRKRAAAKQLIEAYYFQLTDGCGDSNCENKYCASCPAFTFKDKDRNILAVTSIDLFKQKAQLCQTERNKLARLPDRASPMTSPDTSMAPLPGPSNTKSSGGATPKCKASTPTG